MGWTKQSALEVERMGVKEIVGRQDGEQSEREDRLLTYLSIRNRIFEEDDVFAETKAYSWNRKSQLQT